MPLVYTLHTMWDDYLHYVATPAFLPAARKLAHAYFRRFAPGRTPSSALREILDFLRRCGVDREVEIIPNAVELERFSRSGGTLPPWRPSGGLTGSSRTTRWCASAGGWGRRRAWMCCWSSSRCRRKDEHVKLLLIGDGPARAELEAQARRLGLGHAAVFTGGVPHDAMREVYACCDLVRHRLPPEVNSISMLEAMAMGLPVLHILTRPTWGRCRRGSTATCSAPGRS